jgi:hypothetical protein
MPLSRSGALNPVSDLREERPRAPERCNARTECGELIIRRSLVRVQPAPPGQSKTPRPCLQGVRAGGAPTKGLYAVLGVDVNNRVPRRFRWSAVGEPGEPGVKLMRSEGRASQQQGLGLELPQKLLACVAVDLDRGQFEQILDLGKLRPATSTSSRSAQKEGSTGERNPKSQKMYRGSCSAGTTTSIPTLPPEPPQFAVGECLNWRDRASQ